MSTSIRSVSVLTCDECGKSVNTMEASVEGAMALRIWASHEGWRYVQAVVPMPDGHEGKPRRRSWDFCGECGVPEKLTTTIEVWTRRPYRQVMLPVTLVGGLVEFSYGEVQE